MSGSWGERKMPPRLRLALLCWNISRPTWVCSRRRSRARISHMQPNRGNWRHPNMTHSKNGTPPLARLRGLLLRDREWPLADARGSVGQPGGPATPRPCSAGAPRARALSIQSDAVGGLAEPRASATGVYDTMKLLTTHTTRYWYSDPCLAVPHRGLSDAARAQEPNLARSRVDRDAHRRRRCIRAKTISAIP